MPYQILGGRRRFDVCIMYSALEVMRCLQMPDSDSCRFSCAAVILCGVDVGLITRPELTKDPRISANSLRFAD